MLRAEDSAVDIIEATELTTADSSNIAVRLATYALGVALLNRDTVDDRDRGLERMVQTREYFRGAGAPFLVPVAELWIAQEGARRGAHDAAIPVIRRAVDELHQAGRLGYGVWGSAVLVATLLDRGAESDLVEAQQAMASVDELSSRSESTVREITRCSRLRALIARARGDDIGFRDLVIHYRAMSAELGFEGHMSWAEPYCAMLSTVTVVE